MNTPFQWAKQVASHFGGTRNGLVISWPARIKDKGGIRTQFHHVIDIAPTILEAAGVQSPSVLNGVPVSEDYHVPFKFTGDLKKVMIELSDNKLAAAEEEEIKKAKEAIGVTD
jgi:arylsulfatase